jgi:hypothetical protein
MADRHELEREACPVVIPAPLGDQLPVSVVQEEEPFQDRLLWRPREPAVYRLLGGGQKASHERSTNDPIDRYHLILA